MNRLRWLFAQFEDEVVFSELRAALDGLDAQIETFLAGLTDLLQKETYTDAALDAVRREFATAARGVNRAGHAVTNYVSSHLEALGGELDRILSLIVRKAQDGRDFDLQQVQGLLFRGYNGLGTSYTVFRKPR